MLCLMSNMEEDYKPKVLPDFKYYKGEDRDKCPFEVYKDVRARYWWGEMMFGHLHDTEEAIKGYSADVIKWREWLKEHVPNQSARFLRENTDRQLAIAYYIVLLYGKWCPYESEDFIFDY